MGKLKEWIEGFFKGAFEDTLFDALEKEARDYEEIMVTLLLLHFTGLENPLYFYMLELLTYLEIDEYVLRRILEKEEKLPVLFSRFEGWA